MYQWGEDNPTDPPSRVFWLRRSTAMSNTGRYAEAALQEGGDGNDDSNGGGEEVAEGDILMLRSWGFQASTPRLDRCVSC